MRQMVCDALVARAANPEMVFLTGDLGFMALEPLRDVLGERFVNCGVAEQNMMSVAAAMAKDGLDVWTYTIAPFCYARAFEQIRNDISHHGLAVKMLGNGGGFGYGVMGSTHHALEDYGVLLTLPEMRVFAPIGDADVAHAINRAGAHAGPSYVRLGRDEIGKPLVLPPYRPWRRLVEGGDVVVVSIGPIAGALFKTLAELEPFKPDFWVLSELPIETVGLPEALLRSIATTRRLCLVEEHTGHGGLGAILCQRLVAEGISPTHFAHLHAKYTSTLAGSQEYMRGQCGIDAASVAATVVGLR